MQTKSARGEYSAPPSSCRRGCLRRTRQRRWAAGEAVHGQMGVEHGRDCGCWRIPPHRIARCVRVSQDKNNIHVLTLPPQTPIVHNFEATPPVVLVREEAPLSLLKQTRPRIAPLGCCRHGAQETLHESDQAHKLYVALSMQQCADKLANTLRQHKTSPRVTIMTHRRRTPHGGW